jgi:hypothetical protein
MDVLLLAAMAATALVSILAAIWIVPALVLAALATAGDEPA